MGEGDLKKAKSTPSIPSRRRISPKKVRSVPKAFGVQSRRFDHPENTAPGPGQYHKPETLVREMKTCGSVSKLGYGVGFISKVKRFQTSQDEELLPGPGSYQLPPSSIKAATPRPQTLPSTTKPLNNVDHSPGPGEYSPKLIHRRLGITSSFSTTKTDHAVSKEDTPPPGSYYKPLKASTSHSAAAAFRSKAKRGTAFGKVATPGPGQYDQTTGTSKPDGEQGPSRLFAPTNLDRFGEPYERKSMTSKVPGVGHYPTHTPKRLGKQIASSFVSKSKRGFEASAKAPPGPAYYTPQQVLNKRSHLLNTGQHWV